MYKLETRNPTEAEPVQIPKDFLEQVKGVITESFKDHLNPGDEFHIFGQVFPEEIVLACSLQYGKSVRTTTAYASLDHSVGKDTKMEKKLYSMVDFFGSFFMDFFESDRNFHYEDVWSEYQEGKTKFFVRINRDNILLESQTEDFLKNK